MNGSIEVFVSDGYLFGDGLVDDVYADGYCGAMRDALVNDPRMTGVSIAITRVRGYLDSATLSGDLDVATVKRAISAAQRIAGEKMCEVPHAP